MNGLYILLFSEAVTIELISGGVTVVVAALGIITLVINIRANRKQAAIVAEQKLIVVEQQEIKAHTKEIKENVEKTIAAVEKTDGKVEEYHKEVNGKVTKLLEAKDAETIAKEAAALAIGKQQGAEENQAKTDAKQQDQK